jgi:hypothetical protein
MFRLIRSLCKGEGRREKVEKAVKVCHRGRWRVRGVLTTGLRMRRGNLIFGEGCSGCKTREKGEGRREKVKKAVRVWGRAWLTRERKRKEERGKRKEERGKRKEESEDRLPCDIGFV